MRILFDSEDGKVIINGLAHQIQQGAVEINPGPGWHLLKFQGRNLKIKDVEIDDMPIGLGVFTMFRDDGSCCWGHIDLPQASWLPVNTSYAQYVDRIYGELAMGWQGTQLNDHFEFVFDQGVDLQGDWPRHIIDYFAQSTGPHWLPKWKENFCWFRGDRVDINRLQQECTVDRFLVPVRTPGTCTSRGWVIRHAEAKTVQDLKTLGLNYLADLAHDQGFHSIHSVNLNSLYPGGYIGPHIDGDIHNVKKKIYISLDPSDQVYFRFGSCGLVPMDGDRLLWLATDAHVHAVVNDSDRVRNIVSISGYADWPAK